MTETGREGVGLSPEARRERLAELLRERASRAVSLHPLSYSEQSLWFEHQFAPDSAAYHVVLAEWIRSELDVRALRRACQALTDRHPLMRATFVAEGGKPVRRVHGSREVHFEELDAGGLRPDALRERVIEASARPFDIERGPLVRVSLFRRSAVEHVLLLTAHHIVVDGWSAEILLGELPVLYAAERGASRGLPPLQARYADYVRWQSELLSGSEGERLWSYWKEQLAGELPVLDLPTDRPRPPIRRQRGACHDFELGGALGRRLQALARAEGATLFMVLLAAFQVLLFRYSGQEDVLVGGPTAGRSRAEFAGVVGNFVNMVVFRGDLTGDPTFRALLGRCRERVLGAIAHQDYPFPLLVERLQPGRDLSRSPLFQVTFLLLRPGFSGERRSGLPGAGPDGAGPHGLVLEPFRVPSGLGQFDLTLELCETGDGLSGTLKYDADLFEAATMARAAGHFRTLLEGIVSDPDRRVSQLPLLTDEERRQLAGFASGGTTDRRRSEPVHRLFEAQVERTPDAVAVTFENGHFTYRELNGRANRLARYLQAVGVGPDVRVGMYMERSLEMVVGILGVLKAGGAYVPLDPAYPKERLAFMLEDAAVPVVLTQERLAGALPRYGAATVCLDTAWETIAAQSLENLAGDGSADDLAYVIYTSGSTGRPKGVLIPHGALANHMLWMQEAFPLTPADRVFQKTPFSFDASVWEFFAPLLAGARLVLARPGGHHDPAYLVETIRAEGITILQAVPTLLSALVDEEGFAACRSLRRVFAGGEVLTVELQERFFARSGATLHNLYGPTEATIDALVWTCERKSARPVVPIGRPITNTQAYVLDVGRQLVPIGVAGELYLVGAGLARGYLNRPELTREKFVPNPFSDVPGTRLYRTGDRAWWLADGTVEYLGRLDHQVKVRGFRIELGEIEANLRQHPDVREALVVVREDVPGDRRLVAYVVPRARPAPSAGELRAVLGERVPAYMVPSAFVSLDALPMTPNGKVDCRALPAPDLQRPELGTAFVAPRTETERVIAAVWREVLGVERVGIHDNFFHLGGHSLLAAQVMARLGNAFRVALPLRGLFEAATVASLAEEVDTAVVTMDHLRAAPRTPGDDREEIEL